MIHATPYISLTPLQTEPSSAHLFVCVNGLSVGLILDAAQLSTLHTQIVRVRDAAAVIA